MYPYARVYAYAYTGPVFNGHKRWYASLMLLSLLKIRLKGK